MRELNPSELENQTVVIVGLGLMGGSLAMALRGFVGRVTAVDTNLDSLAAAFEAGVIDRGTADLADGIAGADLVILATPVSVILDMLGRLPNLCPSGCLVLDLGSTKGAICEAMVGLPERFEAIGGHPMCGKERGGFGEADGTLFEEQTFILCRTGRTTQNVEELALNIVEMVGGRPLFLRPEHHDKLVSVTSHLPYLVSSMLMRQASVVAEGQENLWQVSASGFRDTARLSGSNPVVMGDILLTNRTAVLAHLYRYREGVDELIGLLEGGDDEALLLWLDRVWEEYWTYKEIMNGGK